MVSSTYRIDEVCSLVKGEYPTLKTEPGEYPLVVTAAYRRTASTYQLEGPAVCVPLTSSTGHGHASIHRIHYQEGKFALANLLVALVPNDPNICNAKYLYYLLMTKKDEYLVTLMQGTANVSLKIQDIVSVEISLPPPEEQNRVVTKIESLMARIEEVRKLRVEAVGEAQGLIDSAINHILSQSASEASWEFGPMPVFAEINPSRMGQIHLRLGDPVSFVPMKAVDEATGTIAWPETRPLSEVAKGYTWFAEGDVIFARITPCMQNGKAAIARNLVNDTAFGSTEFHVIKPGPKLTAEWLHALVRHKAFRDDAAAHFKGTAGQQRVPQSFLEKKVIPVPPLPEQRRIVDYLDSLKAKMDELKKLQAETERELEELIPSILDKAFKGEL